MSVACRPASQRGTKSNTVKVGVDATRPHTQFRKQFKPEVEDQAKGILQEVVEQARATGEIAGGTAKASSPADPNDTDPNNVPEELLRLGG